MSPFLYGTMEADLVSSLNANMTASDEALQEWVDSRTGPMTGGGESTSAYFRLPDDSLVLADHPDPSAGPNTPHFGIGINVSQELKIKLSCKY